MVSGFKDCKMGFSGGEEERFLLFYRNYPGVRSQKSEEKQAIRDDGASRAAFPCWSVGAIKSCRTLLGDLGAGEWWDEDGDDQKYTRRRYVIMLGTEKNLYNFPLQI